MFPRVLLHSVFAAMLLASSASAHPPGVADEDQGLAHEVEALHEAITRAVKRKDAALLRKLYADNFAHTDETGRVQKREERVRAMIAGEPMIEAAPAEDLNYRVYGTGAIVITGKSPLRSKDDKRTHQVRWIAVYVRTKGDWQLVASQATRLP
jgi:hypothetical protein